VAGPAKARFQEIFADGIRISGNNFRIISLPGTGLVGYATAKSLGAKPARNRQRRRAQACLRSLESLPELDLVISIQARAANTSFEELCNEMGELLVRTKTQWVEKSESS
jgi:ribonuclease P protein component